MKVFCLSILSILVGLVAFASSVPQVVEFGNCGKSDLKCSVEQIAVDPCPNYGEKKYCTIKRGSRAAITMNFTPHFEGVNGDLEVLAYTDFNGSEQHFREMNKNACDFMTCPFAANVPTVYNYTLEVDRKNPPGVYVLTWKMTVKGEMECCFSNKIKLK